MNSKKITAVTAIIGAIIAVCTFLWGSGVLKKEPNPPTYTNTNNYNSNSNRAEHAATEKPSKNTDESSKSQKIRKGNLFEFPIYSETDQYQYVGGSFYFCSSVEDARGYKHTDSYVIRVHSDNASWVRYDLNGAYKTLSGTLYRDKPTYAGYSDASWLEFYDGDEWIYTTEKLTENNQKIDLNLDISGVKYLTIYFCSTSDLFYADIIADPLIIE